MNSTTQLIVYLLSSVVLVKLLDLIDKYFERRRAEKAKSRVDQLMTVGETRKLNLEEVTFVLTVYKQTIEGLQVDMQRLKEDNRQSREENEHLVEQIRGLREENEKCEERCTSLEEQVKQLQAA